MAAVRSNPLYRNIFENNLVISVLEVFQGKNKDGKCVFTVSGGLILVLKKSAKETLGDCLSYFSIAGIKHYGQSNL